MSITPCPSPVPAVTTGVVTFVPATFKVNFPSFATILDAALVFNFSLAQLLLNNSCCSVVRDANVREALLNLLVAHLTALAQGENGKPPTGIVGRIDSATEGTVSISAAYASQMSTSEAYFAQTQWGAVFWQATAQFRAFRYVPAPQNACVGRGGNYFGPGC